MPQKDNERYEEAAHAMQSGVAMMMNFDPSETTPKHLRVGVNSAMSDVAGVARLLISKGIITEDEYVAALADEMERERDRYARQIERTTGAASGSIHLA
jgi:2-polyprenyl-6-methoxyphenol hydroxylase-like FAD-dependent oxidoreductase